MKLRQLKTIAARRTSLEQKLKLKFSSLSVYPQALADAQTKNCENMIGATSIPLGIAGPLKVNGSLAKGSFYLPLATTEAALVASVNRGCKAVTESGGATAVCQDVGISRGSVFKTSGIKQSISLKLWMEKNLPELQKIAKSLSSHLHLLNIKIKVIANLVFVRFSFDTMEAMGMNMATFAADRLTHFVTDNTGINCLSLAANFDNDKKPSYLNFLEGRGRSVIAEVLLPASLVSSILKTTPAKLYEVSEAKCHLGSMLSGSLAFNAHYANVLSALFIALGQDVAHVAEGSVGITSTEIVESNLYISVFLPDLPLGTVGGGTGLPSQQEALRILNLVGSKTGEQSKKLAEIVGAGVLAGEISLLAALAEGSLAKAHRLLTQKK